MKPSDKPDNVPEKLWSAKMRIAGYWSGHGEVDVEGALELVIEYLIEKSSELS